MRRVVNVKSRAHTKICLHASKYPHSHVGGFLIGQHEGDTVIVEDVLPVCHGNPVGPLLELAGSTADRIYSRPLQIVGYYYADEIVDSPKSPVYINKIMEDIRQTSSAAVLTRLIPENLGSATAFCLEV
jgi:hypothetical protein